ncbi:hypothetical protein LBMAG53_32100 [Planctomycetota bacterium]|nr:hypothetical protein LBMAG53_32100 [Planctomycetota bacterium]
MNPQPAQPDTAEIPAIPLVDLIVAEAAASPGRLAGTVVGECLDDRHPSLPGRVLVRIADGGATRELWVATLVHSVVRRDDRVLLLQPANWPEPVVVGVLDGLRSRTTPTVTSAALELRRDEQIDIRDHTGAALLTIVPSDNGPLLRLARSDQRLEVAGRLTVAAEHLDLRTAGDLTLTATGDVVVNGETVQLN